MAGKHQDSYKNDNPASNTALNSPGCNRNLTTNLSATWKPAVCLYTYLYTQTLHGPPLPTGYLQYEIPTENPEILPSHTQPHSCFPTTARQRHLTTVPTAHAHGRAQRAKPALLQAQPGDTDTESWPGTAGDTSSCPCHCRPGSRAGQREVTQVPETQSKPCPGTHAARRTHSHIPHAREQRAYCGTTQKSCFPGKFRLLF